MDTTVTVFVQIPIINQCSGQKIGMDGMSTIFSQCSNCVKLFSCMAIFYLKTGVKCKKVLKDEGVSIKSLSFRMS